MSHPFLSKLRKTVMLDKPGSPSIPPSLQPIAKAFRITGWISLWAQLILTVVSSGILLFASAVGRSNTGTVSPGTGAGALLTTGSVFVLFFSIYWAFRYVSIGRRLQGGAGVRPKKAEAVQTLRVGLLASLVGMLLALIGAEATVGLLVQKAFSQGLGGFVNIDPSKFIQPIDIFVVQASINVILAQFAGLASTLWLLQRLSRQ
jgi:hypothetical protein